MSDGSPTPIGSYSLQFNQAGIYYYWSGYVEVTGQITFRGTILVKNSIDKELQVNVNLNGFNGMVKNTSII
jgi:hypothetical protein